MYSQRVYWVLTGLLGWLQNWLHEIGPNQPASRVLLWPHRGRMNAVWPVQANLTLLGARDALARSSTRSGMTPTGVVGMFAT
jgi:hypothetical protein